MTYDALETSIESGQPVEVYRFLYGTNERFYTSAEDEVTLAAQAYEPIAGLRRGEAQEGPEKRDEDFSVVLPTDNDVAQLFTGTLTGFRVKLRVMRFHRTDTPTPQSVVVFDGYIHGASFQKRGSECRLVGRPTISSSRRVIPPRTYQASCNHILYDPTTCRVDETDSRWLASNRPVISQSGIVLTVDGLGGYDPGWFTGGFVRGVDFEDHRTILDDDGTGELLIMMPFATVPTVVDVLAGCPRSITACKEKFDNVINFGGFPFVPEKNVFETGIE